MASSSIFEDGVLVEQIVDNGDGTGSRTNYRTDPPSVTVLNDLPIPDPEPTDTLETLLTKLSDAQSLEEVRTAAAEAQEALQ